MLLTHHSSVSHGHLISDTWTPKPLIIQILIIRTGSVRVLINPLLTTHLLRCNHHAWRRWRRLCRRWPSTDRVQHLQSSHHGHGKCVGIFFAAEIESINMFVVPPLMKRRCGLVVFQPFQDGTIDDHFVILQLSAHHSKRIVNHMLINMHFGKST